MWQLTINHDFLSSFKNDILEDEKIEDNEKYIENNEYIDNYYLDNFIDIENYIRKYYSIVKISKNNKTFIYNFEEFKSNIDKETNKNIQKINEEKIISNLLVLINNYDYELNNEVLVKQFTNNLINHNKNNVTSVSENIINENNINKSNINSKLVNKPSVNKPSVNKPPIKKSYSNKATSFKTSKKTVKYIDTEQYFNTISKLDKESLNDLANNGDYLTKYLVYKKLGHINNSKAREHSINKYIKELDNKIDNLTVDSPYIKELSFIYSINSIITKYFENQQEALLNDFKKQLSIKKYQDIENLFKNINYNDLDQTIKNLKSFNQDNKVFMKDPGIEILINKLENYVNNQTEENMSRLYKESYLLKEIIINNYDNYIAQIFQKKYNIDLKKEYAAPHYDNLLHYLKLNYDDLEETDEIAKTLSNSIFDYNSKYYIQIKHITYKSVNKFLEDIYLNESKSEILNAELEEFKKLYNSRSDLILELNKALGIDLLKDNKDKINIETKNNLDKMNKDKELLSEPQFAILNEIKKELLNQEIYFDKILDDFNNLFLNNIKKDLNKHKKEILDIYEIKNIENNIKEDKKEIKLNNKKDSKGNNIRTSDYNVNFVKQDLEFNNYLTNFKVQSTIFKDGLINTFIDNANNKIAYAQTNIDISDILAKKANSFWHSYDNYELPTP